MRIVAIALTAAFAFTATCAVAQAHTPWPKATHRLKHHAARDPVSERRNVWPDMPTGSSMQGYPDVSSWHSGIEQMDSTPSGE
jgi:hypothetical protein